MIRDLGQVRALADPLRLRLLGVFSRGPHTTKQVAEILGEKPTRLYHHVEALERAGLIELKETRQKRGTVERYYQAIGTKFTVAESVLSFAPGPAGAASPVAAVVASILDTTREEIARAAQACPGGDDQPPLVARALLSGRPERMKALRAELLDLLERARAECPAGEGQLPSGMATYAMTVAFYRVADGGE
jgi:DNA-binding transcriptional ArsR family regulator